MTDHDRNQVGVDKSIDSMKLRAGAEQAMKDIDSMVDTLNKDGNSIIVRHPRGGFIQLTSYAHYYQPKKLD